MTKIMIVEDDNSLRDIYNIRLTAEGYEVVSAADGEAALAVAVKEKPDLILADVMMPKISGFDMLDILRQTPETKNIRVVMMTALSSEEQRARGESLGADRYLVKSQVGIEDVVNAIHEVLEDKAGQPQVEQPSQQETATPPAQPTQPETPLNQPAREPEAVPQVETGTPQQGSQPENPEMATEAAIPQPEVAAETAVPQPEMTTETVAPQPEAVAEQPIAQPETTENQPEVQQPTPEGSQGGIFSA